MPVRSGRFSIQKNAAERHTIVTGRKNDAVIRVFNSGYIPFKVIAGKGQPLVLSPSYSYDVMGGHTPNSPASKSIMIEAVEDGVQQGMYEHLTAAHEIRSGRFNTNNVRFKSDGITPFAPNDALLVADLTQLSGQSEAVYYRFFNSGDAAYGIYLMKKTGEGDAPTAVAMTVVEPEQSLDISVTASNGAVWVKSQSDAPIEGIYDFLDRE